MFGNVVLQKDCAFLWIQPNGNECSQELAAIPIELGGVLRNSQSMKASNEEVQLVIDASLILKFDPVL